MTKISFTVTLKYAQYGTDVFCGISDGYLIRSELVGNTKRCLAQGVDLL